MKNLSLPALLSFMVMLCLFAPGCGREKEKKYRIGVSQCSGDYWRVKTNEELKRELLTHDDVELEIRSAENDNARQAADIRYFIDNGFDLIIVSPNETEAMTPVVEEAFRKGIPVVTFDRRIRGDSFTAHMEVDNYGLGKSVSRYAGSVIHGPINIIEIQGPTSASPARLRHEGFTDGLKEYPDAKVLASVYANWNNDLAYHLMDSLIDIYPATNLVYAHTDYMAIGAAKALRKKGRSDIAVMGIDGFPHIGIQAVKDSLMTATFLYPSEGERLLRIAVSILKGEPYERITQVPPLSPIDLTNADIYLSQDALLTGETEKINILRDKIDDYWTKYSAQRVLLYAVILITLLLAGLLFLLLRAVHTHRRHRKILLRKNSQLEEEKKKQQELYDRLRDATQSKLMFFTNVSHDLRTPLTLISGPVEQIAAADYLQPRHKAMMQIARKNVNILRRLIDQILDFRKYENGYSEVCLSETSVAERLKEWTDAFRDVAARRDIRLTADIDCDGCGKMAVDIEKLERVFFNLMSNAFKHTPDNGKITVTCCRKDDIFTFSVKDNGSGIATDDIDRIFDRFYQAGKSVQRGYGIGLALTKAFVELHGGTIRVISEQGKGSEFIVEIPVRHCTTEAPATPTRITPSEIELELAPSDDDGGEFDSEKPMLLVIDDNKDIRTMITVLLGDSYNVIGAPDGQQGLRMAVKYVPDIIICDVMMPVMDGLECVKRLKSEVSTSHIPVLMLTACSMDEQRVEGYESGADGYLPKPFSTEVIESRCRNLLANRRRIKEIYAGRDRGEEPSSRKDRPMPPSGKAPNDVENDFYTRFVGIITSRLGDTSLSIDDIASEIGLSQSQLTRKIKALTNYTPVEIIRNMRLRKARKLLFSSDRTVSEIAFEVGFSSLAYFSKCYKAAYGESPTDVRGKGIKNRASI